MVMIGCSAAIIPVLDYGRWANDLSYPPCSQPSLGSQSLSALTRAPTRRRSSGTVADLTALESQRETAQTVVKELKKARFLSCGAQCFIPVFFLLRQWLQSLPFFHFAHIVRGRGSVLLSWLCRQELMTHICVTHETMRRS
jgi:hypothetical protein